MLVLPKANLFAEGEPKPRPSQTQIFYHGDKKGMEVHGTNYALRVGNEGL
jgi:hypothetical protein